MIALISRVVLNPLQLSVKKQELV